MKKSKLFFFVLTFVVFSFSEAHAQFKIHGNGSISMVSATTTGGVQIDSIGKTSFEPNVTNSGALLTQTKVQTGMVKAWNVTYASNPPQFPIDRFYVTGGGNTYAHAYYTISSGGGSQNKGSHPIENASELLSNLNGYYYDNHEFEGFEPDFIDNPNIAPEAVEGMMKDLSIDKKLGLSAEDLEAVLPEAIRHDPEGMVYINYSAIIPVLVEAFKEQQSEIEHLKRLLNEKGLQNP
jgi:hypothetical protein